MVPRTWGPKPIHELSQAVRRVWCRFLETNQDRLQVELIQSSSVDASVHGPKKLRDDADRRLRNMRFCRQSFKFQVGDPVYCGAVDICPFCWSRQAGSVWDRVADLVHPRDPETGRYLPATCDLVTTTRRLIIEPGASTEFVTSRAVRTFAGPEWVPGRAKEIGKVDRLGAYEVMSIQPMVVRVGEGSAPRLVATIRQLFAVPSGAEFKLDVPNVRTRRYAAPSVARTAAAVAGLCKYPRGLLFPDPAFEGPIHHILGVVAYMEARRGRRLWVGYGGFHKSSKTKAAFE